MWFKNLLYVPEQSANHFAQGHSANTFVSFFSWTCLFLQCASLKFVPEEAARHARRSAIEVPAFPSGGAERSCVQAATWAKEAAAANGEQMREAVRPSRGLRKPWL